MRLTTDHVNMIKQAAAKVLDAPHTIWLFGSRVDDDLRGGDIDLFFETTRQFPNRVEVICRLYGALIMALGDRKIDVLLKDGRTADTPVFQIARQTGVQL